MKNFVPNKDPALTAAIAQRNRMAADLRGLDEWIERWKTLAGAAPAVAPVRQPPRSALPAPVRASGIKVSGKAIVSEVDALLRREGHPMTRSEIVKALKHDGKVVSGRDKERNVAAVLWRSRDKIGNIKGHGYWPTDLAWRPAGYEPAQTERMPSETA